MKSLIISLLLVSGSLSFAAMEQWQNKEGKTAKMELVSVEEVDGKKVGTFRLINGRTVTIPASKLSDESSKRLDEFSTEAAPEAAGGGPSVFDDIVDGNLVKLDGKRLKSAKDVAKPKKYYVFYYTASWCGPCQAFTPSLVTWYEENKNSNFELILITSDSDKDAMEGYAVAKKMPWPQLKLRKAQSFKKKFDHGVTGIPSVIVCDLEGKNLGNYRSKLSQLSTLVAE